MSAPMDTTAEVGEHKASSTTEADGKRASPAAASTSAPAKAAAPTAPTPAKAPAKAIGAATGAGAGAGAGVETKGGETKGPVEFQLSATLGGHSAPIRDVACAGNDLVAVGEERSMLGVWERKGTNDWVRRHLPILEGPLHKGRTPFLFSLEHTTARCYPPNTFVSGGGDFVARPWTAEGKLLDPLTFATHNVNSFSHTSKGELIVGSWDGVARVYRHSRVAREHSGHLYAVEVCGLPTGEVVTGSANKHITIFNGDKIVKHIPNAHTQPIRKIVVHPLGFASAANDGLIKVWSNTGELLMNITAHTNSLVYGLTLLPTNELVSSAEDGEVRIWGVDGAPLQSLQFPGPVRGVRAMPNGDLVLACADRCARIFTRDPARFAPESELASFNELTALVKIAGLGSLDTASMADEKALRVPGKRDGEPKVINVPGKGAQVFKWSEAQATWEYVGDAIGRAGSGSGAPAKKMLHEGVEYDIVTDIEVTAGYKIPLAFNRDDDPYEIATNFCAIHGLPPDYIKPQIIEWITPMCDPEAHKLKAAAAARDAEERKLVHVPSWNSAGFELYASCNVTAMKAALIKNGAELREAKHEAALEEGDSKSLERLIINITDSTNYHAAPFSDEETKLMHKMLSWPTERILPVLDCMRVLMCHAAAVTALASNVEVHKRLFAHAKGGPVHASLVLKILTNWVAKRKRVPSERATPPTLPKDVSTFLMEALDAVADSSGSESENVVLSYAMFLHNVMSWFGRLRIRDSDFYPLVASGACEMLAKPQKPKVVFYGLLTLGSIAFASEEAKRTVKEAFGDQITGLVRAGVADSNREVQQVSHDLRKIFAIKL